MGEVKFKKLEERRLPDGFGVDVRLADGCLVELHFLKKPSEDQLKEAINQGFMTLPETMTLMEDKLIKIIDFVRGLGAEHPKSVLLKIVLERIDEVLSE